MRMARPATAFATLIAALGALVSAPAAADLLPSPYLPLTADELSSANASIGGTFLCTTEGSYDATTFDLSLTGSCPTTGLTAPDGSIVLGVTIEALLTGQVDNNGDVIGGTFSLTGTITDLGIVNPILIASGTLIDAEYGPRPGNGASLQTLIHLDFLYQPFVDAGFGELLYWESNANVSGWFGGGGVGEWESSVDPSDFSNFTGSQYFFLDEDLILPEPGSLALFISGLLLLGLRRRGMRAATR